ncbi:MAG TPA: type II toxin-antitoxin system HicB family antitoxin [Allocoleopsis sp.]
MRYKVYLKKSDEGYAVWCPSLPGCCSQGDTREEALSNIESAIEDYLSVLEKINQGVSG